MIDHIEQRAIACAALRAITAAEEETPRERWARWDAEHPRERKGRETAHKDPASMGPPIAIKAEGQKITKTQALARAREIDRDMTDFYGVPHDKRPIEVDEFGFLDTTPGGGAYAGVRDMHKKVGDIGRREDERILVSPDWLDQAKSDEYGVDNFRIVAHEIVHLRMSGTQSVLPGFSKTVEEGSAEVLSHVYWAKRGQPYNKLDAVRVSGKGWVGGRFAQVQRTNYEEEVGEVISRAASKVGWDRDAVVGEVKTVMGADHGGRIDWRDSTNTTTAPPEGVEATGKGMLGWLLGDEEPTTAAVAPRRAMAAALRLVDPRPLTDLEIGYLDSVARHGRDDIERDLAGRHWHAYSAAAVTRERTRDVSKKLARLDQRLGDQLYAAAVAAVREALKRAGIKAIVRARTKTMRAAVDREGLTDAMLAAISVNADELLDRAFETFGLTAKQWMALTAKKRRELIAQMYDLGPDEIIDRGVDRRIEAAVAILVALLLVRARAALSTTRPREERDVDLPFGVVRTAMRVVEGWDVRPEGDTLVAVRPARDATHDLLLQAIEKAKPLPDLDALARGDAVNVPVDLGGREPTLVARYRWVHDFWGTPASPFGPHLALDGVEYTEETRGMVLAADPNEWPYVPMYAPGDHEHCQCGEEVTWEPESVDTGEPVGNQVLIEKRGGPF